jgi:hypothetical protein
MKVDGDQSRLRRPRCPVAAAGGGIAVGAGWAWQMGIALAVGPLWFLVAGTVLSVPVLVLLLTHSVREALGRG